MAPHPKRAKKNPDPIILVLIGPIVILFLVRDRLFSLFGRIGAFFPVVPPYYAHWHKSENGLSQLIPKLIFTAWTIMIICRQRLKLTPSMVPCACFWHDLRLMLGFKMEAGWRRMPPWSPPFLLLVHSTCRHQFMCRPTDAVVCNV